MASKCLRCSGCGRDDFRSQRGLTQHIAANIFCRERNDSAFSDYIRANLTKRMCDFSAIEAAKKSKIVACLPQIAGPNLQNIQQFAKNMMQSTQNETQNEPDDVFMYYESEQEELDEEAEGYAEPQEPDTTIRADFLKYVASKEIIFCDLSEDQANAVRLLKILRDSSASLALYDAITEWHLRASGKLQPKQKYTTSPHYVSTKKLYKELQLRYDHMEDSRTEVKRITLPHSKVEVKLLVNDAKVVMRQLLTDPRITDDDYLFFNNDPLSEPPEDIDEIKDLNTGRAYIQSYRKYIQFPGKQVLLPVLFYIDGANTALRKAQNLCPVDMSLGIFTRKAREQRHFWRPIGFIPDYCISEQRGKREFIESDHMDAWAYERNFAEDGGQEKDESINPAQDLHTMLDVIFESYVKLQETGFMWDLFYRNTRYNNIEFVLFTPFLKLDTDEAEKLCGKYRSRGRYIQCLCRYCECPTEDSDKPFSSFRPKKMEKIKRLIAKDDTDRLKALSQQKIENACYKLRFGAHNDQGVHGSCPMDMLHQILLGLFKYARNEFFDVLGGNESDLFIAINGIAQWYGEILSRQSLRDFPRLRFNSGLNVANMNAKDYPGILLLLACTLQSARGKEVIADKSRKLADDELVRDWQYLFETLLQFEMWMRKESMKKDLVIRCKKKFRYLMALYRKVVNRTKGMGLKFVKFHGLLHIPQEILDFGIPLEADTGANESGHKAEKKAARLTQRCKENFEEQTNRRMMEYDLLQIAELELDGRGPWDYYQEQDVKTKIEPKTVEQTIGGEAIYAIYHEDMDTFYPVDVKKTKKENNVTYQELLMAFLYHLQDKLYEHNTNEKKILPMYSRHVRKGIIFRASMSLHGEVWQDWALVNFGRDGDLPCHIHGFLDLSFLPGRVTVNVGTVRDVTPGYYAIVEYGDYIESEEGIFASKIFRPIVKEITITPEDEPNYRRYYLIDVNTIRAEIAVVPDLSEHQNHYFEVVGRDKWASDFEEWLKKPYADNDDWLLPGEKCPT